MRFPTERTVYVVAWENVGSSGGFEWRYNASDAQALDLTYAMFETGVQDNVMRHARFAHAVPYGLDGDGITDLLELEFASGDFDQHLWPEDFSPAGERVAHTYNAIANGEEGGH